MSISKKDVDKVADLARLALSDKESERTTTQLKRILEHVEKLSELNTEGVEPTSFTVPMRTVTRDDDRSEVSRSSLSNSDALKNSPSNKDGSFKVPQIIE